jgi:glycosyltransferase involved in cell wall biosynthesis
MRLSVVIPCYNAARFLAAALDSVVEQGVSDLEIIVIDDGSSDDSAAIARSHRGPVTCVSQPNAGISPARNAGVRLARGEFLAFLDADDVWTEGSLAARFAVFDNYPSTECVFGALQQFLEPGIDPLLAARLEFDESPAAARFAGTMLIRRESFLRAGAFDVSLRVGEMMEWLSRAEAAGVVVRSTPEVVMRRRIHGANTMLTQRPSQADYLRALKSAMDRRRAAAAVAPAAREVG